MGRRHGGGALRHYDCRREQPEKMYCAADGNAPVRFAGVTAGALINVGMRMAEHVPRLTKACS